MTKDVYISGVWHRGQGAGFQKTCPARGDVSWSGHAASPSQVAQAVNSARSAFKDWSRRPQIERSDILKAYATAFGQRREAIALAISRDMGKPLWESRMEADAMAGKVGISIAAQSERAGHKTSSAAFGGIDLSHRPHGVMAVMGPYNFPGHLPNGHIVPALLAGNTCVFKPSELAPSAAALMVEAMSESGLPHGCVNIVNGGRDTGAALIEADIDGLLFTGSAETGLYFHKHFAGRPEVILALEMGGNNPLIVWEPCEVEAAADIAFLSAYLTSGQRCSCARRLIIPKTGFGQSVLEAISERIEAVTLGSYSQEEAFLGPLVSSHAALNALLFQQKLIDQGAKAITPFQTIQQGSAFLRPALIDVTSVPNLPDQELFGPLLQVIRVDSFDEAIRVANHTRFGLAAGLVSDDEALWQEAHMSLKSGVLARNRPTAGAASSVPFGGPGLSGNHRPSAYYAADYCTWPQSSQVADRAIIQSVAGFSGDWKKKGVS